MRIGNFLGLQNQIRTTDRQIKRVLKELSSEKKLLRAADDPVGSRAVNNLKSQLNALKTANEKNITSGDSLLETAQGTAEQILAKIAELKEVAEAVIANGEDGDDDTNYGAQLQSLLSEIDTLANDAEFNDLSLFSEDLEVDIQTGANKGDYIRLRLSSLTSESLGLSDISVEGADAAEAALAAIENAESQVQAQISSIDLQEEILEGRTTANEAQMENLEELRGSIEDLDIEEAEERYAALKITYESQISLLEDAISAQSEAFRLLLINSLSSRRDSA